MKYVLFIVVYLIIDIMMCYGINSWIRNWLLRRTQEKWGVNKYHNMTNKQKDWFENRQTIHECAWDMFVSVILVIIFINVSQLG